MPSFEKRLQSWRARAAELDSALGAVTQPDPDLNPPGLPDATARLFAELVDDFPSLDEGQRQSVLDMLRGCDALMAAAALPTVGEPREALRRDVVLFILKDQGEDASEALRELDDLVQRARNLGVDPRRLLRELAPLASDDDRHGWGSTAEFLSGGPGPE